MGVSQKSDSRESNEREGPDVRQGVCCLRKVRGAQWTRPGLGDNIERKVPDQGNVLGKWGGNSEEEMSLLSGEVKQRWKRQETVCGREKSFLRVWHETGDQKAWSIGPKKFRCSKEAVKTNGRKSSNTARKKEIISKGGDSAETELA